MRRPRSAAALTAMRLSPWMPYAPSSTSVVSLSHSVTPLVQSGSIAPGHKSRFGFRGNSAYRTILPFFLIVAVVLLLVIRLVSSGSSVPPVNCPPATEPYRISRGNTCWDLAQAWGISVDEILDVNKGLNCDSLRPGQSICLPERKT